MTAHDHAERVPGCLRCETSGDELGMTVRNSIKPIIDRNAGTAICGLCSWSTIGPNFWGRLNKHVADFHPVQSARFNPDGATR